jgi:hypothetical protein
MLLFVDNISMLYPKDSTKAGIEVQSNLSEMYNITNQGLARPFLSIKIQPEQNGTSISLVQKAFITMIPK